MFRNAILFACIVCMPGLIAAQRDERLYRSAIRPSVGLNAWQLVGLIDNAANAENIYLRSTPTYGIQYDFMPISWFSIGGSYTYNNLRLGADKIGFNISDKYYEGAASAKLLRHSAAVRLMGHYYNRGKWDLYGGFRVGMNFYRGTGKVDTPDFTEGEVVDALVEFFNVPEFIGRQFLTLRGTRPTVQVVPLAVNYYLTDNIGLGLETAIGPTQYLAFQANVRF